MGILLAGVFYHGWHSAGTPTKERARDDFLTGISTELEKSKINHISAEEAIKSLHSNFRKK